MIFTHKKLKLLFLLIIAACILVTCKTSSREIGDDLLLNISSQAGWRLAPENPIIQAGDFIDKGLWNDPHVMKEGGKYIMYLTSSGSANPMKPPVLPYRAVSNDGLKWTLEPKQPLLRTMGTPFVSIETPSVVKYKNIYHMFYTGVYKEGSKAPFAIGHAESIDGVVWKSDDAPILTATGNIGDWNGYLVGEPGAVIYDEKIHLYFTAVQQLPGADLPISQVIGVATSIDGRVFTNPRIALKRSNVYPELLKFCGYSTPMATVEGDNLHLFFDVVTYSQNQDPNWQQVALHHAVSTDRGSVFVQDDAPMFTRKDFDWTRGEILAPSALMEDGKIRLWFSGHVRIKDFRPMIIRGIKGREFGIGYAEKELE